MMSRYLIRGCCHHRDLKCGLKNEDSFIFKECFNGYRFGDKKYSPNLWCYIKTEPKQFLKYCSASGIKSCQRFDFINQSRAFHSSCVFYVISESKKPSSKVEESTEAIKEKAKEVTANKHDIHSSAPVGIKDSSIVKKNLRQKILDEINHYYHGFRLLFIDIKVSSALVWKVLKGGTLTRREYNLLIRTVGDMFRLVPFSIFIIVPFMELLLPVFIKLFPGMLPSTFQTSTEKDDKMKQSLKVKLEMAKFLQQTLDDMALTGKGHSSQAAKDFIEFFHKVRTEGGGLTTNEDILKFSKLFEDEITLDSLTRSQLIALCRVLELQPFGTTNLLRFQLRMKLRSLAADDLRIKKEGVESLTQSELQQACRARGMRALGMSERRLRTQLTQWLDLSLNEKVPPSLLLLSRAFMLPETITTTEKLVATISALPDTVATKTKAVIGEREGKVDNKTKIELIKEEVAKIQEEKKEIEEEAKVEKFDVDLIDKAPTLIDTSTNLAAKEEKDISAKDIGETLENVLDAVSKDKKKLLIEKEELDDLKEEMKDYDEDVQHLKEVTELAKDANENIEVKESKAAKRLSRTVNKLIKKMDVALTELEKKGTAKKATLQNNDTQTPSDEVLRMDELIEAIHKLQKVPDTAKSEKIIDVLEKIDIDKDGVVKVDDLLKVLEVIDRENITLKQKQIEDVIDLLKKEEAINEKKVFEYSEESNEIKSTSNKQSKNGQIMDEKAQIYKIAISPTLGENIQSNISTAADSIKSKPHNPGNIEQKANGHRDDPKTS